MSLQNNPLISILIPTYNNGKYISQAIESVYAQNYDNMEIIVVDDGSTDNTKEVLKQYKDIKYFYVEHKGIPFVRNLALEKSQGEYIAFLDSDDYWLPEKLNIQMQYFKEHPDCEIVFTKYKNFFEEETLKTNKKAMHEKLIENVMKQYLPSSIVKKNLFERYGYFDENYKIGEDSEFLYRLLKKGINLKHYIDKIFYMRRLHRTNISFSNNKNVVEVVTSILRKGLIQ